MLSEHERDQAIKEGHRNEAEIAFFQPRSFYRISNQQAFNAGFDRGWDAACAERDARIAEQDALIAKLRLEAQIHAQEARTANATIAEIYQSVTGGTGEPGNWHGAAPVKARIAALEQAIEDQKRTIDCLNAIINDHGPTTENVTIVGKLEQQLAEARKDADAFTDEQLEAAVKAWFQEKIVPGKFPFHKRMRAAIAAAIKEQT